MYNALRSPRFGIRRWIERWINGRNYRKKEERKEGKGRLHGWTDGWPTLLQRVTFLLCMFVLLLSARGAETDCVPVYARSVQRARVSFLCHFVSFFAVLGALLLVVLNVEC